MSTPKISVIVPVWNTEEYLAKCLDSLIDQTFDGIEIICVDDGSTDGSLSILNDYAAKDSRIVVVHQANGGLSAARNTGMANASAEYIMFCDGDDYYEPSMCETMLEAMENQQVDIAICGIDITYYANQELKSSDDDYYGLKFYGKRRINDDIVLNTNVSADNKIFRKAILQEYGLTFLVGMRYEDAYFFFAYLMASHSIFYVNEKLYHYIRRGSSIMANTFSEDKSVDFAVDHLRGICELHKFLDANGLLDANRTIFWKLFTIYHGAAYGWAKSNSMRAEIQRVAKEFVFTHQNELAMIDGYLAKDVQRSVAWSYRLRELMKSVLRKFATKISLSYRYTIRTRDINMRLLEQQQKVRYTLDRIEARLSILEH